MTAADAAWEATSGEGWVELAIEAAGDDLEAIADLLGEYAPGAVWIEPAIETSDHRDFAYRLLGGGVVRAVVPEWTAEARAHLEARLATLPRATPAGPVAERPVGAHDWAEEWKRFYHVLHAGERLVVRPSWEEYAPAEGEVVIVLDPGAAFGTGQHPSTRLCLAALERELRPSSGPHVAPGAQSGVQSGLQSGLRCLDVGCGSGILTVAAAALGALEVVAVDIEGDSVRATLENAHANGVSERVRAGLGSLGSDWPWPQEPPTGGFDLVVANISAVVLTSLLPAISAALAPGGRCIGAGFIEDAAADVRAAVAAGLTPLREETLEDDGGTARRCLVAVREG